jgi:prepilin-type N-terminal cleavage/methylation domain-containing protein
LEASLERGEKESFLRIFSKSSRERGVTLIELAVVMAIIAIMGLFLVPAIGEWLDNYRIRQAARDIVSTLQLAKMRAISTHHEYRVIFDVNNNTYKINKGNSASESTSWGLDDGVQAGDEIRNIPKNVDIVDNAAPFGNTAAFIEFNPNSTAVGDSIFITNTKDKRYRIIVSTSGRIRFKEGWERD